MKTNISVIKWAVTITIPVNVVTTNLDTNVSLTNKKADYNIPTKIYKLFYFIKQYKLL